MVFFGGLALLLLGTLWAIFPRVLAIPVSIVSGWIGLSLLWKAWRLKKSPQLTSPASLPTALDAPATVSPETRPRSGGLRSGSPG